MNRPDGDLRVRSAATSELPLVAEARARSYGGGYADHAAFAAGIGTEWGDAAAGDFLLAERDGRVVGTLTALSGRIGVRGAALPCQGVAWVGAAHDARRAGGVGSALVRRCLALAHEREQVVSTLVPFRASFYETFGYGLCDRAARWQVPLPLLPTGGDAAGFELVNLDDARTLAAVAACRSRQVDAGHGDLTFAGPLDGFAATVNRCRAEGYLYARRAADDPSRVCAFLRTVPVGRRGEGIGLNVPLLGHDSPADFLAVLNFLASLRDQYGFARLTLPVDLPLNRLLREPQLPHRGVEHATATCDLATRLQVRILDHRRFLSETPWPDARAKGGAVVAVREPEGGEARLRLEIADGRCEAVETPAAADFACDAKTWAAVAMGDLKASAAAGLGLADAAAGDALALLDTLTAGPAPFCRESF